MRFGWLDSQPIILLEMSLTKEKGGAIACTGRIGPQSHSKRNGSSSDEGEAKIDGVKSSLAWKIWVGPMKGITQILGSMQCFKRLIVFAVWAAQERNFTLPEISTVQFVEFGATCQERDFLKEPAKSDPDCGNASCLKFFHGLRLYECFIATMPRESLKGKAGMELSMSTIVISRFWPSNDIHVWRQAKLENRHFPGNMTIF